MPELNGAVQTLRNVVSGSLQIQADVAASVTPRLFSVIALQAVAVSEPISSLEAEVLQHMLQRGTNTVAAEWFIY